MPSAKGNYIYTGGLNSRPYLRLPLHLLESCLASLVVLFLVQGADPDRHLDGDYLLRGHWRF